VNAHLEPKIRRFCVVKLANSQLLPAFHALNRRILNFKLAHPELLEVPLMRILCRRENDNIKLEKMERRP